MQQQRCQSQCLCKYKKDFITDLDITQQLALACQDLRFPTIFSDENVAVLQFKIMNQILYNFINIPKNEVIFVCKEDDSKNTLRFFRIDDILEHFKDYSELDVKTIYDKIMKEYYTYPFGFGSIILLGDSKSLNRT